MSNTDRKRAYADKNMAELTHIQQLGCVLAGNAYASVLLLKGTMDPADASGLLSGTDGQALRAALNALGYDPADWCGLATVDTSGQTLAPATLRLAITTLDPTTLIVLDDAASQVLREAYASELSALSDVASALLTPGVVLTLNGMRTIALGGFAASLASPQQKQVMWSRLKLVPPQGEPY